MNCRSAIQGVIATSESGRKKRITVTCRKQMHTKVEIFVDVRKAEMEKDTRGMEKSNEKSHHLLVETVKLSTQRHFVYLNVHISAHQGCGLREHNKNNRLDKYLTLSY